MKSPDKTAKPTCHNFALRNTLFAVFAFVGAAAPLAQAYAQTGLEVMQQVRAQGRIHPQQRFDVFMQVTTAQARNRKRYFTSWNKYKKDADLGLLRFYKPANLAGTAMLSKKAAGAAAHQWIYLPALRAVRKLSLVDRNQSFMGSDFSNADISGRGLHEDTHALVSQDEKMYYVESIPQSATDPYSKIAYEILKSPSIIRRATFYDRNGAVLKILTSRKVKGYDGMYIVVDSVMRNPNTGSETTLTVENVKIGDNKPDNFFSSRGLKP